METFLRQKCSKFSWRISFGNPPNSSLHISLVFWTPTFHSAVLKYFLGTFQHYSWTYYTTILYYKIVLLGQLKHFNTEPRTSQPLKNPRTSNFSNIDLTFKNELLTPRPNKTSWFDPTF